MNNLSDLKPGLRIEQQVTFELVRPYEENNSRLNKWWVKRVAPNVPEILEIHCFDKSDLPNFKQPS